jgi:transcription elongation factor Elf1
MKSEILKRWIDAGRILAENPKELVRCPACLSDNLIIADVEIETNQNRIERHMGCKTCGAKNALLITREKEGGGLT